MSGYPEGKHDDPADTQDRLAKVGTKYNATAPAVADGDNVYLLVDAAGRLLIAGSVAHDEVDAGNPVKIGVKGLANLPSDVADGDLANVLADKQGRVGVFLGAFNGTGAAAVATSIVDAVSAAEDHLAVRAALVGVAPDAAMDPLRTVGDAAPGLGVLAVGPRSPGASEVKATIKATVSDSSTKVTLLTPTSGKKVRIIAVMMNSKDTGASLFELFFGTGTSILTTPANAIADAFLDLTDFPSFFLTFPDGAGPVGAADAVVSMRTNVNITGNGRFTIIYREE